MRLGVVIGICLTRTQAAQAWPSVPGPHIVVQLLVWHHPIGVAEYMHCKAYGAGEAVSRPTSARQYWWAFDKQEAWQIGVAHYSEQGVTRYCASRALWGVGEQIAGLFLGLLRARWFWGMRAFIAMGDRRPH